MSKPIHYPTSPNFKPQKAGDKGHLHWFSTRAALIIVFSTIALLATILYSGPSFGVVRYRLIVDGGILLLWLAAGGGYGALLLRLVLGTETDAPPVLRMVTTVGVGLGTMSLVILGLGLCGALNMPCAWGLIAGGLVAGIILLLRHDSTENRARIRESLGRPGGAHWLLLLSIPFVVAVMVGSMVPPGFLWSQSEPHPYDVLEYHLQVPREWYEAGQIIPLHHNVFSYFPFNVEMHFLLAMHLRGGPWAGMYLSQFMHGAFVLLSIAAVYGFARWKAPKLAAVLATLAMATVPALSRLAPIAYDEGGLLLFGILAIGWAMRATLDNENRNRRFIVAGLLAGFACGTKLTGVPEILVGVAIVAVAITLWTIVRRPQSSSEALVGSALRTVSPICKKSNRNVLSNSLPSRVNDEMVRSADPTEPGDSSPRPCGANPIGRVTGIILFCLAGLLMFSPWLIRNVVWVGNPIFPEAPMILGKGDFSDVQIERWHRAHSPQPGQQSPSARLGALKDQVLLDWQFGYVLLPLSGIAFALSTRRRDTWFLGGLMLLLLIIWLGFTHLQGRFFILGVPIGALLIATGCAQLQILSARKPVYLIIFSLITIQAIAGAVRLHADLSTRLYRSRLPLATLLGNEDTSWSMPLAFDNIPADSPVIVVGDADVFRWQIPMSRLRYHTVFDVDTSKGVGMVDAWAGPPQERGKAWLLINPSELKRFERTYQPMPPVPDWIVRRGNDSFVVPPGGVPGK